MTEVFIKYYNKNISLSKSISIQNSVIINPPVGKTGTVYVK